VKLTRLAGAAAVAIGGVYLPLIRPRILRWGATAEEARRRLPGEGLVPDARRDPSTMAVTIDAPPERVWPWLVQMGCDRAGWYSYDRLDNAGRPSAETLVSEWQSTQVGDRLAAGPSGRAWFTVARLDPGRTLVLRASNDPRRMTSFDPSGPRPGWFTDGTWEFVLEKLDRDRTRLIVGGTSAGRPWLLDRLAKLLLWEPAHFIMQRKQFRELKRRVEGAQSPIR
jgi:proline iminopeptidase